MLLSNSLEETAGRKPQSRMSRPAPFGSVGIFIFLVACHPPDGLTKIFDVEVAGQVSCFVARIRH